MPLAVYPWHYSTPLALDPLPIDAHVATVRERLARHRALVLTAAPGAGKTTRVPPALLDHGPLILLQPRRVAARAVAQRIANERGWTIGREVGWQVRFERRFGRDTRLLVVTEGILTARLQSDPLLSDVATIVLDEFHERSIHADLGLALARQAWLARDDLRILVMSATLDARPVARFLRDCPILEVAGTRHPLTIEHAPATPLAAAAVAALQRTSGNVLCFLPGAREIAQAVTTLAALPTLGDIEVVPLHGSLDAEAQDRALAPSTRRRIVVATNVAETSLTVPGVSAVIDSGLHRVARYDAARGIDRLELERIPLDAADQRAGRAARLGPGLAIRLWEAAERLRPHREPEIARVDLCGAVLSVLAWGEDPATFEWFEPPSAIRIAAASALLQRLGAMDGPTRAQLQQLPLHPRLGRVLLAGHGSRDAAAACALLSERTPRAAGDDPHRSELLGAMEQVDASWSARRLTADLQRAATAMLGPAARDRIDEEALRRAVLAGYPDRVARRRGTSAHYLLASGHGATFGRLGAGPEWLVALDVVAADRAVAAEAIVRLASSIDGAWLTPTATEVEHAFDPEAGRVRASRVVRYDALELSRHPVPADPAIAIDLLAEAWLQREPDERTTRLIRRARFAGRHLDLSALARHAASSAASIADMDLAAVLPYETARDLASLSPETIVVPSGREVCLEYTEDGGVFAAVKLQELFGLADTPRIGGARVPVVFHLLAPNGRPVQTTSDLRSFWTRTYADVRKELRGRYPKHPWPEDPWTATPTARSTRRGRRSS